MLFITLIVGCSKGALDFESEGVEGRIVAGQLQTFNKTDAPIWYFAIERESAARTYWVPISDEENKIEARQNKTISLDDISGYEKGDEVIFYYWTVEEPESGDTKNIVIDTK